MAQSQIENLCLFCATTCCPKFLIEYDGKLTKFKVETTCNGMFTNESVSSGELLLIEEDLKAIFIVSKLLNVPQNELNQYLGKYDGQCRPGLWFPICDTCDTVVQQCYRCYKEIAKLEKALENGKIMLKRNIFKSTRCDKNKKYQNQTSFENYETSVWESVRNQIISIADFDHDFVSLSQEDEPEPAFMSDGVENDHEDEDDVPLIDRLPTTSLSTVGLVNNHKKLKRSRPSCQGRHTDKYKLKNKTTHKSSEVVTPNPKRNWNVVALNEINFEDWRVLGTHHCKKRECVTYYCYLGGKKCGARLKKQTFHTSGKIILELNSVKHSLHKTTQKITQQQKQLILDRLNENDEGQVQVSESISSVFQPVELPQKRQIYNFLSRQRRKGLMRRRNFREALNILHKTQKKSNPDLDSETGIDPGVGRQSFESEDKRKRYRYYVRKTNRYWFPIETVPEKTLHQDWRVLGSKHGKKFDVIIYYCYDGQKKCGARLRKRICHHSGDVSMYSNNLEHSNHIKSKKYVINMEQKELILDSLSNNIDRPDSILAIFEQKTISPPTHDQLKNFISRQRMKDLAQINRYGETLFLSRTKCRRGEGKRPYKCEYCEETCRTILMLELHQSSVHQEVLGITPVICEKCGFSTGSTRYFHYHKQYKCRLSKIKPRPERRFVCKICDQGFKRRRNLIVHMQSILHRGSVEGHPSHFKFVNGLYVCNYCGERMKAALSVVKHMQNIHKEKSKVEFRCDNCSETFEGPRTMINHRKICKKSQCEVGASVENGKTEEGPSVKIIRCKLCPMEFNSYKMSLVHKKTVHTDCRHMCDSCGDTFTTLYRLNKHKNVCGVDRKTEGLNKQKRKYVRKRPIQKTVQYRSEIPGSSQNTVNPCIVNKDVN